MISKQKRRNLVDLYRKQLEFFTRDGKLCVKFGNSILTNLVMIGNTIPNEIKSFPVDVEMDFTCTASPADIKMFEDIDIVPVRLNPNLIDRTPSAFIEQWANAVIPPKGI